MRTLAASASLLVVLASGCRPNMLQINIEGGQPASLRGHDNFEGVVALVGEQKRCAGAVISSSSGYSWVATALHCVRDSVNLVVKDDLSGVGYSNASRSFGDCWSRLGCGAASFDDVAVVRFDVDGIQPLELAELERSDSLFLAVGWGVSSKARLDDTIPLQQVELSNPDLAGERLMFSGRSGGCSGDSGGPLLVNREGRRLVVGILMKGSACGIPPMRTEYIRIDSILPDLCRGQLADDFSRGGDNSGLSSLAPVCGWS